MLDFFNTIRVSNSLDPLKHMKFHQGVNNYREVIALSLLKFHLFFSSHNSVTNGWNFMKRYTKYIYDLGVVM